GPGLFVTMPPKSDLLRSRSAALSPLSSSWSTWPPSSTPASMSNSPSAFSLTTPSAAPHPASSEAVLMENERNPTPNENDDCPPVMAAVIVPQLISDATVVASDPAPTSSSTFSATQ